jgi:6-phosphogluconate dehydrogenase (decarboxylating)
MQLGMIGLGRMGSGMTERLREGGHDMKSYDPNVESRTAGSLEELKQQLDAPRAFWMMIPAGKITQDTFQQLLETADEGDTIVDGGNSNFRDSQRRYADAKKRGLHFVDAGVSGGIWGLEVGFCLMVGGDEEPVRRLEPVFTTLARAAEEAVRLGERDAAKVLAAARAELDAAQIEPEYLELRSPEDLSPVDRVNSSTLLAVAARVGPARLIDNTMLGGT